jgi:LmbE family N-acetylglucosaminyl deacetylase
MARPPTLVVLSPHPDDAVLAIGGLLAQHTRRGGHAVIVTVFTGIPQHDRSPIARRLYPHQPGGEVVRIRRGEDLAAGRRVHADVVQLPHLEALYRTGPDGTPRYTELDQIFSAPTSDPEPAVEPLAHQWTADGLLPTGADVLAPLGIGGHVDHWIVRQVAETAHQLTYPSPWRLHHYEDQPYASRRPEHCWQHLVPHASVSTAHPLTTTEWRTKLDAITCHASQIPLLWPNGQPFEDELQAYAEKVGAGTVAERTWSPRPPVGLA